MKTESVIDFPKDTLCPEIWDKVIAPDGVTETYNLKKEVHEVLQSVILNINEITKLNFDVFHITGSITSNSYTENADIDLHFLFSSPTEDDEKLADLINEKVKAAYKKTFIGKHPIEVYFLPNKFQDMMSVGCYDINLHMWIVGPELTDPSFNPYSEYYKEILEKSASLAALIRNMIFSIYEIAVVMKKNIGTEFHQNIRQILVTKLEEVQLLYDNIRLSRKVYSSPSSEEEALQFRSSRKWKIADGAFKLFDKYGYTAILKKFIEDADIMTSTSDADEEIVDDILSTVKNYINNVDKLAEKELFEAEQVDEGAMSNMLLATLLAIPGILPAKTILKTIDKNLGYEMIVKDLNLNVRMIGDYTAFQAANIIARTLYAEARNDGEKGMNAVASVIFNRAEGDKTLFTNACLKPKQFSCWNKFTKEEADPKNFKIKIPSSVNGNKKNETLWKAAMQIAADMLADSFKPTTNANMYYNDKTAHPDWGNQLTSVKYIGSHKFGILKNHSAFV